MYVLSFYKISKKYLLVFFLQLRSFQHGPSRAHIETQPITITTRLARDTNNLVDGFDLSLELELKSQHDTNCSFACRRQFIKLY